MRGPAPRAVGRRIIVSVNKIKVAKLTVREMYILKDIDDNKITVNRLSRNEKAILSTLRIYDELGSSYQWPVLPDVYFRCFPPWEMEEYYKGHRVPLWMIKRDCGIKHASSLSRTLKTLLDKDLIYPHGYDMGSLKCMDPMHGSDYAKYISLSYLGYQIVKQIEPIQVCRYPITDRVTLPSQ